MKESRVSQATIDDVAQRARVSISTVSRVLNNRDRVHPETRERILRAMRELQYQPSAMARGLANQRTHTLGFIIPTISDPFFIEIVRGVEDAASSAGYSLLVASQAQITEHPRYTQLLNQRRVDGVVLVAIEVQRRDIEAVLQSGIPIVLIQQDIGAGIPTFIADNYGGACQMTEHLLRCGHRRIAYISGSNHTPDNGERLRGVRDTLTAHGLRLPANRIAQGNYLRGSGYEAMMQLLKQTELPDAVFAANDQMASDALIALQENGLRVPDDVAVVGFDDVPLASYVTPALTTVHQPAYELGLQAAQCVLQALEKPMNTEHVVLPTHLVVRKSCGCP
ncbi:MAG: DNA-binding transcriptional regulator, LacI/PurR family [Chloroflexi bacterium AL-W]|nr:DNA-binding transcriptional regulator, LacI/PurR family [Chloroflexi bacterium AL-N1]NOK71606.1 DNA-binding transcriptional regulator, LacI/PurR family [Chloroflexi bacterium AL-N10]NOK78906.1 DNA-binding transcriptional regulator, LacI/PurR family [Chloroflexi bacterium AL-N5]NOK86381.1 DNA-binding transcriptional regulator, LacI/PurR family [Chloroflexi bacterium AL-W]